MAEAFLYDAVRTPRGRGKSDGALYDQQPIRLLTSVLKALRERNALDTSLVDDVVMGCVAPVGEQGADIARTAVLTAGYDPQVAGVQLNRFCSSGLEAVNTAAARVMAGQEDLLIAGGVESMSRVPMGSDGGALFTNPEIISRHRIVPQGISADLIATKWGYSREQLDRFAADSHRKAAIAWQEGRFGRSVIPALDEIGQVLLDQDEGIRTDTTEASLARLNPAFEAIGQAGLDALALLNYPALPAIRHVHHAGNSSQITDGAAGILIGSKAIGEKLGLKPRARIRGYAVCGSEPTIMLTGPVPATRKALSRNGMSVADIDLFEINEAFAAIPLLFMEELGIDAAKVNVNGGAIALGHPLGATGAILLMTLLDELERTGKGTGLASLCIGGGMGIATIIERL